MANTKLPIFAHNGERTQSTGDIPRNVSVTMGDRQYHLKFDGSAAASVDAYAEYRRIVGDDDGGTLFTPEQYEAYKRKVSHARTENRLFVSWTSPTGMDCKLIGPETICFCEHRYKQHKSDFDELPSSHPIHLPCEVRGCRCRTFQYVPSTGTQPARCGCKHLPEDHKKSAPHRCVKGSCSCAGFQCSMTCGCGEPAHVHKMLVETSEERAVRGMPVGHPVMFKGMGGITGFSSLLGGYERLDPSGRGAPSLEFLGQPITAADHPFLRDNVRSIRAYQEAAGASQAVVDADLAEMMSAMKAPGETDMDFYERRYQERLKAEREAKRGPRRAVVPPIRRLGPAGRRAVASPSDMGGVKGQKVNPKPSK